MKDVTFQLDTTEGSEILKSMAAPIVKKSADAIAHRATSIANAMTDNPPEVTVTNTVGTIKRGVRAIATVRAEGKNDRQNYIGYMALTKARDAGRLK